MKVLMINSLDGLRGRRPRSLGQISATEEASILRVFETAVEPMVGAHERLQAYAARGKLSIDDADRLENLYRSLQDRVSAHATALHANTHTVEQAAAWSMTAERLAGEAEAYAAEVRSVIGLAASLQPWKLAAAIAGSVVVLGGVAYYVVRRGSRGSRRVTRRRRRKR